MQNPGEQALHSFLHERQITWGKCTPDEQEDIRVLAGACTGSAVAWDGFFRRFGPFLRLVALKLSRSADYAEDLASAIITDLFHSGKLKQYNGRGSVRGWLRTVATNRFLDERRRNARARLEDVEKVAVPVAACQDTGCERHFRRNVLEGITRKMEETLADLSGEKAGFLNLYYFQDVTLAEAAQKLHVHESTACRWNEKILQKIRKDLVHYMRLTLHWSDADIEDFLERCMEYLAGRMEKARQALFPA